MELFIRVDENGNAVGHPMLGDNFREVFPHVDIENLPPEFAKFVRVPFPTVGVYEVVEGAKLDGGENINGVPTYQRVNGVFTDVWPIRQMTDAEKTEKQQNVKNFFGALEQVENWSAWVFDEATCTMQPPVPRPVKDQVKEDARIFTYWCGAENGWKDSPPRPHDENQYRFDFLAWQWVQVVN
jgi:hypothetical protein